VRVVRRLGWLGPTVRRWGDGGSHGCARLSSGQRAGVGWFRGGVSGWFRVPVGFGYGRETNRALKPTGESDGPAPESNRLLVSALRSGWFRRFGSGECPSGPLTVADVPSAPLFRLLPFRPAVGCWWPLSAVVLVDRVVRPVRWVGWRGRSALVAVAAWGTGAAGGPRRWPLVRAWPVRAAEGLSRPLRGTAGDRAAIPGFPSGMARSDSLPW